MILVNTDYFWEHLFLLPIGVVNQLINVVARVPVVKLLSSSQLKQMALYLCDTLSSYLTPGIFN